MRQQSRCFAERTSWVTTVTNASVERTDDTRSGSVLFSVRGTDKIHDRRYFPSAIRTNPINTNTKPNTDHNHRTSERKI